MKTGQRTRNNKGFTLIEMILVIAVMGVLAGMAVSGINYIIYGNTKKCANRLVDAIDEVQMLDMTKADTTLLGIFQESGELYIQRVEISAADLNNGTYPARSGMDVSKAEKIAQSGISLQWQDGASIKALDDSTLLLIGFAKSSGAYLAEKAGATGGRLYSGNLWVKGKGTWKLVQVAQTGKHYLEE